MSEPQSSWQTFTRTELYPVPPPGRNPSVSLTLSPLAEPRQFFSVRRQALVDQRGGQRLGPDPSRRASAIITVVTKEPFGSQRFRRALNATGAELLDDPVKRGSFYCHAEIAKGGQGTVYLGTGDDQARSRPCVIKTFSESDRDTIGRADRSIRTQLGLLDVASAWPAPIYPRDDQIRPTPWVPDILAWDLTSRVPWVAQDFRGPNLRKYLEDGVGPEADRSYQHRLASGLAKDRLLSQIVSAVEFVHEQGVVHRDLKPDNILVEQIDSNHMLFESVVLCDFDLSKSSGLTTLTQTAVGMGTFGYSAPEQLLGGARDVTRASDVYAVGMLAVYLHTGREPWEVMIGSDLTKLKLDAAAAETLSNKRAWVEQALSFRPEERPQLQALYGSIYGPDAGL